MPYSFKETLLKATQMTRDGHLMDATRLIQQALAGAVASAAPPAPASAHTARAANDDARPTDANVIDVEARQIIDGAAPAPLNRPINPRARRSVKALTTPAPRPGLAVALLQVSLPLTAKPTPTGCTSLRFPWHRARK